MKNTDNNKPEFHCWFLFLFDIFWSIGYCDKIGMTFLLFEYVYIKSIIKIDNNKLGFVCVLLPVPPSTSLINGFL